MDEIYLVVIKVLVAFFAAGILSFLFTPPVKKLAHRIGAIDIPKDSRRMHKKPIPRLGGLAIYLSFVIVSLLMGQWTMQSFTILIGSAMIVVLGIFDDRNALGAKFKFGIQLVAAAVPVIFGNLRIELITNPNILSNELYLHFGVLSIPITIIWIVAITNAVNLIDGLDGLAVGVSAIACMTMLAVSLLIGEIPIAILLAVLAGACVGFMPFNLNPASIFMGDTGSTFLGFMLATLSIQGMFKVYAIISFAVPFLILGLPIFDTAFAFTRRILSGRSPFSPDRGHVHHRLIDMGFNQKQTVAILYIISTILGLLAVVLTTSGEFRAIVMVAVVLIAIVIGGIVYLSTEKRKMKFHEQQLRDELRKREKAAEEKHSEQKP
ncbi:MAG: undecaprenyl/decaprenyl-phosphate alpha-N-acetylglucosaminyl 1-phosphate transferase [Clostridia bacterium]|nr:undecaprenyl/decaprenyl-phosphate alpha-N-acetylglucosaminyl 1-phosphate transferase [Clostridia bacterium]